MKDLRKYSYRMGLKGASGIYKRPDGLEGEGEVGKCGHWDAEYDWLGYCRDEQCRKNRIAAALRSGKAARLSDGTIVWMAE